MHRRLHQPHLLPSDSPAAPSSSSDATTKRGSYNCGRYGLPKKGHSCHAGSSPSPTAGSSPSPAAATASSTLVNAAAAVASFASAVTLALLRRPTSPAATPPSTILHLCCVLSFDDLDVRADKEDFDEVEPNLDERDRDFVDGDADAGGLPVKCLWEVQRRLLPTKPLAVAWVCKGWWETSRRVWRSAEDLKLRVPSRAQLCFVGSVLNK